MASPPNAASASSSSPFYPVTSPSRPIPTLPLSGFVGYPASSPIQSPSSHSSGSTIGRGILSKSSSSPLYQSPFGSTPYSGNNSRVLSSGHISATNSQQNVSLTDNQIMIVALRNLLNDLEHDDKQTLENCERTQTLLSAHVSRLKAKLLQEELQKNTMQTLKSVLDNFISELQKEIGPLKIAIDPSRRKFQDMEKAPLEEMALELSHLIHTYNAFITNRHPQLEFLKFFKEKLNQFSEIKQFTTWTIAPFLDEIHVKYTETFLLNEANKTIYTSLITALEKTPIDEVHALLLKYKESMFNQDAIEIKAAFDRYLDVFLNGGKAINQTVKSFSFGLSTTLFSKPEEFAKKAEELPKRKTFTPL